MCWSQRASTRHKKLLVSGTIGAFQLCGEIVACVFSCCVSSSMEHFLTLQAPPPFRLPQVAWTYYGTESGTWMGYLNLNGLQWWGPDTPTTPTSPALLSPSSVGTKFFSTFANGSANPSQFLQPDSTAFDPRTRDWYVEGLKAKPVGLDVYAKGVIKHTSVYTFLDAQRTLGLSAVLGHYEGNTKVFAGVHWKERGPKCCQER